MNELAESSILNYTAFDINYRDNLYISTINQRWVQKCYLMHALPLQRGGQIADGATRAVWLAAISLGPINFAVRYLCSHLALHVCEHIGIYADISHTVL